MKNEKLRELLRAIIKTGELSRQQHEELEADICAALSQQAEPCEFHVSDQAACQQYSGQVPCEPAPAQDEREALSMKRIERLQFCKVSSQVPSQYIREMAMILMNRPAQTEQQPVAMQPDCDAVAVCGCRIVRSRKLGNVIILCAAHITQTAPQGTNSEQYRDELYDEVWDKALGMGYGNVTDALAELERMKTAPQPEQSGLTDGSKEAAMQKAFELGGIEDGSYHLESDELELVIRSALAAQGESHE